MSIKEPCGVIAIFTSPDGRVIATAADFDRQGYGGFKLWEAQRTRARQAVKWKAVQAYASPALTDSLSGYLQEQIAEAMLAKGHKLTIRGIGYDTDTLQAIQS